MKIGAIIQARYQSTRLPGKVLMPLPMRDGIPILKYITDAVKRSSKINYACIATSDLKENDVIEKFAEAEEVNCFRGSENDVLSRFIQIIKKENIDVVIRLTGDNPLVDVILLDELIAYHIAAKNDYTKSVGLPIGMNYEIVNGKALTELKNKECTVEDKEHVTKYIFDHSEYRKYVYEFNFPALKDLRCTIDYPSDYAMMNLLIPHIKIGPHIVTQLFDFINHFKWVAEINQTNHQVKYYDSYEAEVEEAKNYLLKGGFLYAAEKLK